MLSPRMIKQLEVAETHASTPLTKYLHNELVIRIAISMVHIANIYYQCAVLDPDMLDTFTWLPFCIQDVVRLPG